LVKAHLFKRDGELPDKLRAGLGNHAFKAEEDGAMSGAVDRGMIEEVIDEVVNVNREFANISIP